VKKPACAGFFVGRVKVRRMKEPHPEQPKWDAVFLVCRECHKRGSGPKDSKPKEFVTTLRKHAGQPRPRVVETGCLGLCPKRATAVAVAGGGNATRIVAVKSKKQLAAVIPLLRDAPRP
jgi:predicted metal-binding protein